MSGTHLVCKFLLTLTFIIQTLSVNNFQIYSYLKPQKDVLESP